MNRVVIALSGGMDSTALVAMAWQAKREILPVSFVYGSRHNDLERKAAELVCTHFSLPGPKVFDLSKAFEQIGSDSNLLKTGAGPIPEGHYEAESMKQTVVHGRNLIFASVLAGFAWANGYDSVWLGVHAGDHAIYPDCRPGFIYNAENAVRAATDGKVFLTAPFLHNNKADIVRSGVVSRAPFHLTRTCYTDYPVACGRCGSCQERLAAFADADEHDPLEYQSREILPK